MEISHRIIDLYQDNNKVIKLLIAGVEARTEHFHLPLFNEMKALHDHITRCYSAWNFIKRNVIL